VSNFKNNDNSSQSSNYQFSQNEKLTQNKQNNYHNKLNDTKLFQNSPKPNANEYDSRAIKILILLSIIYGIALYVVNEIIIDRTCQKSKSWKLNIGQEHYDALFSHNTPTILSELINPLNYHDYVLPWLVAYSCLYRNYVLNINNEEPKSTNGTSRSLTKSEKKLFFIGLLFVILTQVMCMYSIKTILYFDKDSDQSFIYEVYITSIPILGWILEWYLGELKSFYVVFYDQAEVMKFGIWFTALIVINLLATWTKLSITRFEINEVLLFTLIFLSACSEWNIDNLGIHELNIHEFNIYIQILAQLFLFV